MSEKPPFKLGIVIGPRGDTKEFKTDLEFPPFAINQANRHIHENYSKRVSLFLVDEDDNGNRRKSRRRQ